MRISGGIVALLVVLAGCGGGGGGDRSGGGGSGSTQSGSRTTPGHVASAFKAKTGVALRTIDDDETWTTLVPPPTDAAAQQKYGTFTIYVLKDEGGASILLKDAEPADARGIAWKAAGGGQYLGTKRYGDNVYLQFSPSRPGKQVDAQFTAVDAVLAQL